MCVRTNVGRLSERALTKTHTYTKTQHIYYDLKYASARSVAHCSVHLHVRFYLNKLHIECCSATNRIAVPQASLIRCRAHAVHAKSAYKEQKRTYFRPPPPLPPSSSNSQLKSNVNIGNIPSTIFAFDSSANIGLPFV